LPVVTQPLSAACWGDRDPPQSNNGMLTDDVEDDVIH
jgi:hypothetical protein